MIVEVVAMQRRRQIDGTRTLLAPAAMAGLAAGVGFMYVTAMLVKI